MNASQIEKAMDFCRRWYNLEEIRSDEMEAVQDNDDDDEARDMIVIHHHPQVNCDSEEPKLPLTMNLKLAWVKSLRDGSVKDAVLRCLQSYLDHHPGDEILTQMHINVLHNMNVRSSLPIVGERWRPTWQDMMVCCWVEKLFVKAINSCRDSPLAKLFPTAESFDALTYLQLLSEACPLGAMAAKPSPLKEPVKIDKPSLSVDEHKDTILRAIQAHRVVIIQGATGCGKSSRIPTMLLRAPPPDPALKQVRMFISQPRRVAAKALVERVRSVEPDLRDKIALRMGHGVKEYESPSTRAWFVTTGYLVRLLANNPVRFNSVSHLIIDEVHERSVDTDILCLLCRRLLNINPHIRLVLMSATLAASLYQVYFEVQHSVIQVGARRFLVKEVFLEDLEEIGAVRLPPNHKKRVQSIITECSAKKCLAPPSNSCMEKVYQLVSYLATVIGSPGSSEMIFVPGMYDIMAISELVEQVYVAGVRFTCLPIHSDIPFEEQMGVFNASAPDEIKIIIATNAAESSVTLPDVDHVICLRLCKPTCMYLKS